MKEVNSILRKSDVLKRLGLEKIRGILLDARESFFPCSKYILTTTYEYLIGDNKKSLTLNTATGVVRDGKVRRGDKIEIYSLPDGLRIDVRGKLFQG